MKILLAEDDHISQRVLSHTLVKWGHDVIAVADGDQALRILLGKGAPKLAVLDWMMPKKNGVEVCRIIRETELITQPYIILLTTKGDKKDVTEGLDSGADDYVQKPFDRNELNARINVGRRIITLNREMAEKDKLRGVLEMAGAVCHEINQPLMSISGYSELLLSDKKKEDKDFKYLKEINQQVKRIGNITKKLMNITQYKTKNYLKGHIIDINGASEDQHNKS